MINQEFMRKKDSSSSSDNEDQSYIGDDLPTFKKEVRKYQAQNCQQQKTGRVIITYNTNEGNIQNNWNQGHSESQKRTKLSTKSRPSIYNQQYGDHNEYSESERNMRGNRNFKGNQIKIPYFDPNQENRNNYYHQNQRYGNNHNNQQYQNRNFNNQRRHHYQNNSYNNNQRQNNHYEPQRQNNFNSRNNYQRQSQRGYETQNQRYNNPRQRINQRQYPRNNHKQNNYEEQNPIKYEDYRDQINMDQKQQPQNHEVNNHKSHLNNNQERCQQQKKHQKYHNTSNVIHQQRPKRESKPINSHKSHQNYQEEKKSHKVNQKDDKSQTKKPQIKTNNVQKIKNQQVKQQVLVLSYTQQKNQNQRPSQQLKNQLKIKINPKTDYKIQKQNNLKPIKNDSIQLSSDQNGLNKAQKNIIVNRYQKLQKEQQQNKNQQSHWDVSQKDSNEKEQDIDQQSFEMHQLQLQFPLPPIADNQQNMSNWEEDLSLLQAIKEQQKKNPHQNNHNNSQRSINQSSRQSQRNTNDSNFMGDQFALSQRQLQTLTKMFKILPDDERSVFIELKIKTSNVTNYKIKSISSEIFNLKTTIIEQIKNNTFISIKQSEKNVPKDSLPQPNNQINNNFNNNHETDDTKKSKLILAQINYPPNLLEHQDKFTQPQQNEILKKITKYKKKFQEVDELIMIDYITLRCSSCSNKKAFLCNNNNIIPHQCRAECPNFLRFQIESMYIC